MPGKFPSKRGAPALTVHMALGALIIKEKLGLTDLETFGQIKENPYLQYLIGLDGYRYEALFDASTLIHFRKRIKYADLAVLQEDLLRRQQEQERKKPMKSDNDDEPGSGYANQVGLIVDATCAPADIAYPTDLALHNGACQKSEQLIDQLSLRAPEGRSLAPTGKKRDEISLA